MSKPNTFDFFQEASLGGVAFPMSSCSVNFSQGTAEHKILDKDGSFFEMTGSEPVSFSISVPAFDTIRSGPNESWKQGTVFSIVLPKIRKLYREKKDIVFSHPYLGDFNVLITEMSESLTPDIRSGVEVSITLKEQTQLDSVVNSLDNFSLSGLESYFNVINSIIANIPEVDYPLPKKYCASLGDSIRAVQGVADKAEFLTQKGSIMLDRIKENCDSLHDSVVRINNVTFAPVLTKINQLRLSSSKTKKKIVTKSDKRIKTKTILVPSTMLYLSKDLKTSMSDMIRLNIGLVGNKIIPANTQVTYYG